MASEGPLSPASVISIDLGAGGNAWGNPADAVSSNNAYAFSSLGASELSEFLLATDFGFDIPAGAIIDGVLVEIERSSTEVDRVSDFDVFLFLEGATVGDDSADSAFWPTSDAYQSYGGSSDLWGGSWTPAQINDASFGVGLAVATGGGGAADANVDHIRITVYYHAVHAVTGSAEAVTSATAVLLQANQVTGNAEAVTSATAALSQTHAKTGNAEAVASGTPDLSKTHIAAGSAEAVTSATSRLATGSAIGCVHVELNPRWEVTLTTEPQWEVAIAIAPRWGVAITIEKC